MNLKPLNLLCNNKDAYETFTEYLDVLIEQQHRKMEQTTNITGNVSVTRCHPAIKILEVFTRES